MFVAASHRLPGHTRRLDPPAPVVVPGARARTASPRSRRGALRLPPAGRRRVRARARARALVRRRLRSFRAHNGGAVSCLALSNDGVVAGVPAHLHPRRRQRERRLRRRQRQRRPRPLSGGRVRRARDQRCVRARRVQRRRRVGLRRRHVQGLDFGGWRTAPTSGPSCSRAPHPPSC